MTQKRNYYWVEIKEFDELLVIDENYSIEEYYSITTHTDCLEQKVALMIGVFSQELIAN